MTALRSVIDPADLKWIWLTHTDFDHIGTLHQLLAENPELRVDHHLPRRGHHEPCPPRCRWTGSTCSTPDRAITVGDRTLTAVKPPAFDNPSTTGFLDDKSGAFFSSDCFGALLQAVPERADDLSDDELRQGQVFWATIDSPWLHKVDPAAFAKELDASPPDGPHAGPEQPSAGRLGRMIERLLASLEAVPTAQPFVGPDQAALEQMLAQMTAGPTRSLHIADFVAGGRDGRPEGGGARRCRVRRGAGRLIVARRLRA